MAFSDLFLIVCGIGCYRLGVFNERHPGRMSAWLCETARWVWASMNK